MAMDMGTFISTAVARSFNMQVMVMGLGEDDVDAIETFCVVILPARIGSILACTI
jgi:hypothetical protein